MVRYVPRWMQLDCRHPCSCALRSRTERPHWNSGDRMSPPPVHELPVQYEILVKGVLDSRWSA
jgi:hypothetical protein